MATTKINYRILVAARESRAVSQEELAISLNITQSNLSKIENGILSPDSLTIQKIAELLDYNESLFNSKYIVYPLGLHFYRKNKTLQNKYLKQLEALINIRRICIQNLLETFSIETDYRNINFNEYTKPHELAIECRKYWRMPNGRLDGIFKYIEAAGIIIHYLPNLHVDGFSGVCAKLQNQNNYVIFINEQIPNDRIRFTACHELLHILLHDVPTPEAEKEANEFASELLMPSLEIYTDLKNLSIRNLPSLKKKWQVSMASLVYKAKEIGCISEYKYRTLLATMNRFGYKKAEPYPDLIEREKPTLLNQIIDYHINTMGFTIKELSDVSGFSINELTSEFGLAKNSSQLELL